MLIVRQQVGLPTYIHAEPEEKKNQNSAVE